MLPSGKEFLSHYKYNKNKDIQGIHQIYKHGLRRAVGFSLHNRPWRAYSKYSWFAKNIPKEKRTFKLIVFDELPTGEVVLNNFYSNIEVVVPQKPCTDAWEYEYDSQGRRVRKIVKEAMTARFSFHDSVIKNALTQIPKYDGKEGESRYPVDVTDIDVDINTLNKVTLVTDEAQEMLNNLIDILIKDFN